MSHPLLARAVELAESNTREGQRPFGALVVLDDEILGQGVNTTLRTGDPTDHAEVNAVRAACRAAGTLLLPGATVFTSCEPCPMCQAVSVQAGVTSMVFAATSALAAEHGFPQEEIGARMQRAWYEAYPGFVTRGEHARPETPFTTWTSLYGSPEQVEAK